MGEPSGVAVREAPTMQSLRGRGAAEWFSRRQASVSHPQRACQGLLLTRLLTLWGSLCWFSYQGFSLPFSLSSSLCTPLVAALSPFCSRWYLTPAAGVSRWPHQVPLPAHKPLSSLLSVSSSAPFFTVLQTLGQKGPAHVVLGHRRMG